MPDKQPRDMFAEQKGELLATRDVLWSAVRFLDDDQAEQLRSETQAMADSLRSDWGDSPADHQAGIIEAYTFLALRLRNRFNFVERDESTPAEWCIICLQCQTFPIEDGLPCPLCDTDRWLHIVRI